MPQSLALVEERLQGFCITGLTAHDGAGMKDRAVASPDCGIPHPDGEDFQPLNHPRQSRGSPGSLPHPEIPIFPKQGEVGE